MPFLLQFSRYNAHSRFLFRFWGLVLRLVLCRWWLSLDCFAACSAPPRRPSRATIIDRDAFESGLNMKPTSCPSGFVTLRALNFMTHIVYVVLTQRKIDSIAMMHETLWSRNSQQVSLPMSMLNFCVKLNYKYCITSYAIECQY